MKILCIGDSDPLTGLRHRCISENGLVVIGIFSVLYGYRVRAGFHADRHSCVIDWCAGSEFVNAANLMATLIKILQHREEDQDCFDGLRRISNIKPVWNDPEFMEWLTATEREAMPV